MSNLPTTFLQDGEALLWQGRVDVPLLIRRQMRRLAIAVMIRVVVMTGMVMAVWGLGPRLFPTLLVPVLLVSQGILRRNRERDIYVLTNQRVGVWSAPSGPAARVAGMDEINPGKLMLPLADLDHVRAEGNTVRLSPIAGRGHFEIQLTDLPEAPAIADKINAAKD